MRSYKLSLDSDDEKDSDSDIENALSKRKPVLSESEKVEQQLYEHGLPPTPLKRSGLDKLQLQTEGLVNVNEDLGEEFWKTSWKQPSIPDAEAHWTANLPVHGKGHTYRTPITSASAIPLGIRMYFQMLKSLCLAFLFGFLCSVPSLMFVYYGQGIHPEAQDTLGFYRYMLGNLGHSTLLGDGNYDYTWSRCTQNATLPSYNETCLHVQNYSFTPPEVSFLVTSMELLQIIILLCTIVHIRRVYRRICVEIDVEHQVSVEDYSVVVSGLPVDVTKEELVAHFSNLYQLSNVDFQGRMPIEDARPVQHCGNSQHTLYLNTFVADIYLTRNLYPLLLIYKYKQEQHFNLFRLRALMKMTSAHTPHPGGYDEDKQRQYEEEMLRLARGVDRYMLAMREVALQSRIRATASATSKTIESGGEKKEKEENKDEKSVWAVFQGLAAGVRGMFQRTKSNSDKSKDKLDAKVEGAKSNKKGGWGMSRKSQKSVKGDSGEETKEKEEGQVTDAENVLEATEPGDEEEGKGGLDKVQMDGEGEALEFQKVALRISNNENSNKDTSPTTPDVDAKAALPPPPSALVFPNMGGVMDTFPPLSATLTFEYVESKVRCLKDYHKYSTMPYRLCMPAVMKFREKHILKVEDAPAPRDILHHHLGAPASLKMKVYVYVYGVVCLLVLGSIVLCICAGMARHTYNNVIPSPDMCSYVIPSSYTPSIPVANTTFYDGLEYMRPHPTYREEYDANCSQVVPGSVYVVYTHPSVYISTLSPSSSPTLSPTRSPSLAPAHTHAPSLAPTLSPSLDANSSYSPTATPTSQPILPFAHPALFAYSIDRCVQNNVGVGGYCPIGSEAGNTDEVFCPCAYVFNNDNLKNEYKQTKCMSGACQMNAGAGSIVSHFGSAETSMTTPELQCGGYSGDSLATCYCVSFIDDLLETQGILTYLSYLLGSPAPPPTVTTKSAASASLRDEYAVCSDVHRTIMYAFVFKYISIIYTILADQGIYYWLTFTSEHIPYATKEQFHMYTFLSLTIARYVNLALVGIVGYGLSITLLPVPSPSFGVYGDATRLWYGDGGYFLLLVYMLFTILPLVWDLAWYYVVNPLRRHFVISQYRLKPGYNVAIQEDLNRLFLGPAFPLHSYMSRICILVLLTFTYAAALPLMVPVTFFTLMLTYMLHRDMYLHYYKTIDFVGKGVVQCVYKLLPYVCIARVIATCWVLSADDIVPNDFPSYKGMGVGQGGVSLGMLSLYNYHEFIDSIQKTQYLPDFLSVIESRLKYIHAFPIFALGILIVLGLGLDYFYNNVGKYLLEDLGKLLIYLYRKCFPGDPNKGRLTRHPNFLHAFELFSLNDPIRKETAPYTGVYYKYLCRKTFKPSYFSRVMYYWKTKLCFCFASCIKDPSDRSKLYESLAIGWEVQDMGLDFEVKVKTWPSTDTDVNLMKLKGEHKRTYEVIADEELPYCYNLELIPDYRYAYVNLQEYDMKYSIAAHYLTAIQAERQHALFNPDIVENRLNKKEDGYRKNKIVPINRAPEHIVDQPLLPWQQKAQEEDEETKRKRIAKEKRAGQRGGGQDDGEDGDEEMGAFDSYMDQMNDQAFMPGSHEIFSPAKANQEAGGGDRATTPAGKKFVVDTDESSGEEGSGDDDSDEESDEDDDDDSSEEDSGDEDDSDEEEG